MGAYLHYGIIKSVFIPRNPNASDVENRAQARQRAGGLIPCSPCYLNEEQLDTGFVFQVGDELLKDYLRDLMDHFRLEFRLPEDPSWNEIMKQNWEDMEWNDIEAWAKESKSPHFGFSNEPYYIHRSNLSMNTIIFKSEGKVVHEYLDGTLDLLTRLMRRQLNPNPLDAFFYVWIS